jgi:hypothetical protein
VSIVAASLACRLAHEEVGESCCYCVTLTVPGTDLSVSCALDFSVVANLPDLIELIVGDDWFKHTCAPNECANVLYSISSSANNVVNSTMSPLLDHRENALDFKKPTHASSCHASTSAPIECAYMFCSKSTSASNIVNPMMPPLFDHHDNTLDSSCHASTSAPIECTNVLCSTPTSSGNVVNSTMPSLLDHCDNALDSSCHASTSAPIECANVLCSMPTSTSNIVNATMSPLVDHRNNALDFEKPTHASFCHASTSVVHDDLLAIFQQAKKDQLIKYAEDHGIQYSEKSNVEQLRASLIRHVSIGDCAVSYTSSDGCHTTMDAYSLPSGNLTSSSPALDIGNEGLTSVADLQVKMLSALQSRMRKHPLQRVLSALDIAFDNSASVRDLRRQLQKFISVLKKGKMSQHVIHERERLHEHRKNKLQRQYQCQISDTAADVTDISQHWPQVVASSLKSKLVHLFRQETSSESLHSFTCACC